METKQKQQNCWGSVSEPYDIESKNWVYSNLHISGFTLLELLVTLSIVAILAFSGIYYHQTGTGQTQLNLYIQQFFSDLNFAKEHALNTHQLVRVCPIEQHWNNGYSLTTETEQHSFHEPFLTRTPPYPSALHIQAHFGLHTPCVYFDSRGQSLFNGHFIYTLKNKNFEGKIVLTQTGKMHLETT